MLYFAKCHYSCLKLYILSFEKKPRSFPQCFDLFPSSAERTGHKKNETFASLALNHPCFAERTAQKNEDFCLVCFESFSTCGENRIRTCEPVLPVTRFPGVPLQPLEHLS